LASDSTRDARNMEYLAEEPWFDYQSYCEDVVPQVPSAADDYPGTTSLFRQYSSIDSGSGVLATVAQSNMLRLGECDQITPGGLHKSDGIRVGSLLGEEHAFNIEEWSESSYRTTVIPLSDTDTSSQQPQGEPIEFIGLSLSGFEPGHFCTKVQETKRVISDSTVLYHISIVNVMMIGWKGDFAHRLGIGWGFYEDWMTLSRETKHILFE